MIVLRYEQPTGAKLLAPQTEKNCGACPVGQRRWAALSCRVGVSLMEQEPIQVVPDDFDPLDPSSCSIINGLLLWVLVGILQR
jgi:hypothetical protein